MFQVRVSLLFELRDLPGQTRRNPFWYLESPNWSTYLLTEVMFNKTVLFGMWKMKC